MTKFNERFFCTAPWMHLYYHINGASPCHLIKNDLNLSPTEYLESEWLKNLKQDFIQGRVPSCCKGSCKTREDLGLKSTRGAMVNYFNVGEIPDIDYSQYTLDKKTEPERIELRYSNLCNFKCRMCNEDSSSEIAREKQQFNLPLQYSFSNSTKLIQISEESDINELKSISTAKLARVCFTGGEPMLIKQYYKYMDYLIDLNLNKNIKLELFTNCSVYNPEFVNRMMQFKTVNLAMSIDAAGKTAEYQRHGTNWDTVQENIFRYAKLPIIVDVTSAITPYTLLDVSALARFFMRVYEINKTIGTKCYTVNNPMQLQFKNLNEDLRKRAIEEIDLAVNILTPMNFDILKGELKNIKRQLLNTTPRPTRAKLFAEYTKQLDTMRNESFESVFDYKLY